MRSNQALRVSAILVTIVATAIVFQQAQGDEKAKDQHMLRHVVLFKFKEGASNEKIKEIEDAFRDLPKRIDTIADFEWGTNNSPEGLAKGFTHCFFVSFADEKGRETYLPHPAHQEFIEVLKPALDEVMVIDYWAKD